MGDLCRTQTLSLFKGPRTPMSLAKDKKDLKGENVNDKHHPSIVVEVPKYVCMCLAVMNIKSPIF